MEVVVSYKTKISRNDYKNCIDDTIKLYRSAVSFIVEIINNHWSTITPLSTKSRVNYVESLIHTTKGNTALYDFDKEFYKFPSYLRRSAIQDSVGIVSSYQSNLSNYEEERYYSISNGKKFKKQKPKLSLTHFKCPVLYKGNMYLRLSDNQVKIKVFKNNDWQWIYLNLRNQDVKYIKNNCQKLKELSPILTKKGRCHYLAFSFKDNVKLNKTKLKDQKIVAVDLGINTSATCSLMSYDGTVHKRLFINQNREKDHQNHLINRLKKKQKIGNKTSTYKSLWYKINSLNEQIINDTTNKIIKFAKENHADVIVFEYLNFKGKKIRGNNNIATRLHLWCKRTIQDKVENKAHLNGIRMRRVNARNTSALAFDGSGYVERNEENYSLCVFKAGKKYHSDLNATYNIGARYYIKEIQKTTTEREWSRMVAKVPQLSARTKNTLSTLISLLEVL